MIIDLHRLQQTLHLRNYRTVFQPIHSSASGSVVGLEALTRFVGQPERSRDWYMAAHEHGLGFELELATARHALTSARALPDGLVLWLNVSPAVVVTDAVHDLLTAPRDVHLGVQIAGVTSTRQGPRVLAACRALQDNGVDVSIETDLAAYLTRQRHAEVIPDQIQSGHSLTHAIGSRPGRRHARRLVATAHHLGSIVVAEGIESPHQLRAWQHAGASHLQGFLLGAPSPLLIAVHAPRIRGDTLQSRPMTPAVDRRTLVPLAT
jgi:EAL domain-containing protein (putative c-di-GMP-specific phosphodiesterase class I)